MVINGNTRDLILWVMHVLTTDLGLIWLISTFTSLRGLFFCGPPKYILSTGGTLGSIGKIVRGWSCMMWDICLALA